MPSIKDESTVKAIRYCSQCDRAMPVSVIEQARFDYGCPTCGESLYRFYSKTSQTHKERDERFRRRVRNIGTATLYVKQHPPVYEEVEQCQT